MLTFNSPAKRRVHSNNTLECSKKSENILSSGIKLLVIAVTAISQQTKKLKNICHGIWMSPDDLSAYLKKLCLANLSQWNIFRKTYNLHGRLDSTAIFECTNENCKQNRNFHQKQQQQSSTSSE